MKNRVPPPPFIVDDDVDLRGFFAHLLRGWKMIAALTVLGILAGWLVTSRITPVYTVRGIVRIPWTWDLAAREPAALVTSALRVESISKGRRIAVARMSLIDSMGMRVEGRPPVVLSVVSPAVESGRRRLEDFLAGANRIPDIERIAGEAQTMARREIERIDQELAAGQSAEFASLIERRGKLQRALDTGAGLSWDLQPASDGRDISQSRTTLVLVGALLGALLGVLGALVRWPRFMMS
jgi:hypothetical protein